MIGNHLQWTSIILLVSLWGMFSVQAENITESVGKGDQVRGGDAVKSDTKLTTQKLLTAAEKAALGGYCELLQDQALDSELTPKTAPLLFDEADQLIDERKIQLAQEYMEGLTQACHSNVLAYSLEPTKAGGAPVLVIERLDSDASLDTINRQMMANLKACIGNVSIRYGIDGTRVGDLPDAQRLKVASWFLEQCEEKYTLDVRETKARQQIENTDKQIVEARERRTTAEAGITALTDEIIANFKADNNL